MPLPAVLVADVVLDDGPLADLVHDAQAVAEAAAVLDGHAGIGPVEPDARTLDVAFRNAAADDRVAGEVLHAPGVPAGAPAAAIIEADLAVDDAMAAVVGADARVAVVIGLAVDQRVERSAHADAAEVRVGDLHVFHRVVRAERSAHAGGGVRDLETGDVVVVQVARADAAGANLRLDDVPGGVLAARQPKVEFLGAAVVIERPGLQIGQALALAAPPCLLDVSFADESGDLRQRPFHRKRPAAYCAASFL